MKLDEIARAATNLCIPYRITGSEDLSLDKMNPADTGDFIPDQKTESENLLETQLKALTKFQEMLYANDRWSLLLVFQAMDAAGKDSAIKHVMSGVNPQGCQVVSFKAPTPIDLDHDYLWRCNNQLPERGRIGIFNRSYYEEVLVVKVHPQILDGQKLPDQLKDAQIWKKRYNDITAYENYLSNNGIVIIKFFLNVSKDQQKKRFLKRIDDPSKNWKFSKNDVTERKYWDQYMNAYQEMISNTATENAPWFVIPADHKWYTRLIVSSAIIHTLSQLNLEYPKPTQEQLSGLEDAKKLLESE